MKVKWLIEHYDPENGNDKLAEEVKKQGMECKVINHVKDTGLKSANEYNDEDCVVFQGSLGMGANIQRTAAWIPGVWLTWKNYECLNYYPHLGKYLLNDRYAMFPLAEIKRQKETLFGALGLNFFIRPNSGYKTFTGKVISYYDFEKDWDLINFYDPSPNTLVVVAPVQQIFHEWRFVVAGNEVITGSWYRKMGKKHFEAGSPSLALSLAQEIAAEDFTPDPFYTIDIAEDNLGNFSLVEINSFSCAGLYACDMPIIVKTVSEYAEKEYRGVRQI